MALKKFALSSFVKLFFQVFLEELFSEQEFLFHYLHPHLISVVWTCDNYDYYSFPQQMSPKNLDLLNSFYLYLNCSQIQSHLLKFDQHFFQSLPYQAYFQNLIFTFATFFKLSLFPLSSDQQSFKYTLLYEAFLHTLLCSCQESASAALLFLIKGTQHCLPSHFPF